MSHRVHTGITTWANKGATAQGSQTLGGLEGPRLFVLQLLCANLINENLSAAAESKAQRYNPERQGWTMCEH